MAVSSYGATRYNLAQLTVGQLASPPGMLGAASASNRFLVWVTLPAGGLLGGAFGSVVPVSAVLWVTTAVQVASALPLFCPGARPVAMADGGHTAPGARR
jgi:hypothetical protein